MTRPIVNDGRLFWTGQHWINFIRPRGAQEATGMVSLWHTDYSLNGEGTVAYVVINTAPSYNRILTDNLELASFIQKWMDGRGGIYEMKLDVNSASFTRDGDIRNSPSWIIDTGTDQIIAKWDEIQLPILLEAPAPRLKKELDVQSCLFFADSAQIMLNEHSILGEPYPVDNWQSSLGGERSSCVFALSDTFIQVDGQGA